MKCIRCGQEMQQDSVGKYRCPLCGQTSDDLVYRGPITATNKNITVETTCCLCGAKKEYIYTDLIPFIYICDDCKNAIAWAKKNMKEIEK